MFKFEIGQIVYHRLTSIQRFEKDSIGKTPLLILERCSIECSGGTQLQYRCRLGVATATLITFEPKESFLLNEVELEQ